MCGRAACSLAPTDYRNAAGRQIGTNLQQTIWIGQALYSPMYNFSATGNLPVIYYDPSKVVEDVKQVDQVKMEDSCVKKEEVATIKKEDGQPQSVKKESSSMVVKKEDGQSQSMVIKKEEQPSSMAVKKEYDTQKIDGLFIQTMSWGLNSFGNDPSKTTKMMNARSETLSQKPSFNRLIKKQRGVIFVDGFYEWKAPNFSQGKKQPYFIQPKQEKELLCLACLYDKEDSNPSGYSFTVITVEADKEFGKIHDRMPAILTSTSDIKKWLGIENQDASLESVLSLLKMYDSKSCFSMYEVSDFVNSATNQSKKCIKPLKEIQHGKGSLHSFFKPMGKSEKQPTSKRIKEEENESQNGHTKKIKIEVTDE